MDPRYTWLRFSCQWHRNGHYVLTSHIQEGWTTLCYWCHITLAKSPWICGYFDVEQVRGGRRNVTKLDAGQYHACLCGDPFRGDMRLKPGLYRERIPGRPYRVSVSRDIMRRGTWLGVKFMALCGLGHVFTAPASTRKFV